MTHHGRWGGRGLELLVMFVLIAITIALIVFGFWGTLHLITHFDLQGRQLIFMPFFGAIIGGLIAGVLWQKTLKYYRYTSDLKPITKGPSLDE